MNHHVLFRDACLNLTICNRTMEAIRKGDPATACGISPVDWLVRGELAMGVLDLAIHHACGLLHKLHNDPTNSQFWRG